MQSFANVSQSLIETVQRLDNRGFNREADHADAMLKRVAQLMNNPLNQQMQNMMISITQLNNRLKQIEESLAQSGNNPTATNNAASAEAIQAQQQAPSPDMGNANPAITQQIGDFQVTIDQQL